MASSSLRNEILEAKMSGLQLEKDVEDFEKRLRERIERTKQSIEQLSIDCDSNCSKVWKEFDAFLEKSRVKAAELCNQMKQKTTEEERKWRQSLQEKENLLEEAGKWLMDLRRLLVAGNDDENVVSGVRSLEAELSGRLHKSFTPVEEGHFVVTFPEWCQRSLDQLQKEIVDFTTETWYPRKLELQSECRLQDSNLWIASIVGSDEDGHVIVADASDQSIKEFAQTGEVVDRCHFEVRGEKFSPLDICPLSTDIFVICGCLGSEPGLGVKGGLLVLSRKKRPPFLKKENIIKTKENEFSSLCQMEEQIFVCDWDFKEILCFSKDGNQIKKRIQLEESPGPACDSDPLLRADPTTGNLWGTREGMLEICVFDQNGQILRKVETENGIYDFRADEFGQFYFCNLEGIFSMFPEKVLYKFQKECENYPRIFVSMRKLFVCFENDGKKLMKIFKIN